MRKNILMLAILTLVAPSALAQKTGASVEMIQKDPELNYLAGSFVTP